MINADVCFDFSGLSVGCSLEEVQLVINYLLLFRCRRSLRMRFVWILCSGDDLRVQFAIRSE